MNRKERRDLQKKMSILGTVKNTSRQKWFEKVTNNINHSHIKEDEMKENIRLQTNKKDDEIMNNKIASKATEYMIKDGLSYIEALEKAKQLFV